MAINLDDDDDIARAFWKFHAENPDVYDELVTLSKRLADAGRKKYGIGALFEVVRFHRSIKTTDPVFKLNNNFRALYARLIMRDLPELEDFFEIRIRKARVRHDRTMAEIEEWFS